MARNAWIEVRRVFLALAGAIAACSTACAPAESLTITVRDPGAVAIEAPVGGGQSVEILAPGRSTAEVAFPRSEPPYRGAVLHEAFALRGVDGTIALRCDRCMNAPVQRVVDGDEVIRVAAFGTSSKMSEPGKSAAFLEQAEAPIVTWTGDRLRVRLTQPYFVPAGKTLRGPYPAFEYDVVVRRDALVDVRHRREDLHAPGWGAVLVGVPLTALSAVLLAVGATGVFEQASAAHRRTLPLIAWTGGCVLAPLALLIDVFAVTHLVAPSLVATAAAAPTSTLGHTSAPNLRRGRHALHRVRRAHEGARGRDGPRVRRPHGTLRTTLRLRSAASPRTPNAAGFLIAAYQFTPEPLKLLYVLDGRIPRPRDRRRRDRRSPPRWREFRRCRRPRERHALNERGSVR